MATWIKGLFDSKSPISSKRFVAVMLAVSAILQGFYYIIKIQYGGVESQTSVSIIEMGIVSACSLLVGGTAAEALHLKKDATSTNNVNVVVKDESPSES